MKRLYFVKYGKFANTYTLIHTTPEDAARAKAEGYERITRAEAIRLAKAEAERQNSDPSFSGYADSHIFPIAPASLDEYAAADFYHHCEPSAACKWIMESHE